MIYGIELHPSLPTWSDYVNSISQGRRKPVTYRSNSPPNSATYSISRPRRRWASNNAPTLLAARRRGDRMKRREFITLLGGRQ